LRLKTIAKLLIDAYKKDAEDRLWQQWLVLFSGMDRDNFISFEKYKSEFFKPELKRVDAETILKDAEEIKMADQRGGS
jgi:hypothetical protein